MSLHRHVVLLLGATACANPTPVHFRARVPASGPGSGLEVVAVPFDPEALLDSLGRAARSPRPHFPELEARLRRYQASDPDAVDVPVEQAVASPATRDSVLRLSATLRKMDRTTAGYRETYARFRELYARYSAREAARENALRRERRSGPTLGEQAARAADSLRAWERVAYKDFPRLAEERSRADGRTSHRVTTDSSGQAVLDLPWGRWWLSARLADPANPFLEYHWNVALTTAGLPVGLPLMVRNATSRWRH